MLCLESRHKCTGACPHPVLELRELVRVGAEGLLHRFPVRAAGLHLRERSRIRKEACRGLKRYTPYELAFVVSVVFGGYGPVMRIRGTHDTETPNNLVTNLA